MAENINLNNVATFQNDTSAVNTVNNNNAAITTAFTDVLSRSGTSPNQMNSPLDMNNNQIINLPFPTTLTSAARLADVTSAQNITIISATTGTSGHTVPFLDGNNTWSGTQTINPPTGLSNAIVTNQNLTGTAAGNVANAINITTDNIVAGSNVSVGFAVNQGFGGAAATGGRQALTGAVSLNSATNASNPNRTYTGVFGSSTSIANDTGTNSTSSATSAGEVQGANFLAQLGSSATNFFAVIGCECNTAMFAGSSTWAKAIGAFSGAGADTVAGTVINTMQWMYNHAGAVKWTTGILMDNLGGLGNFPISTTGTIFKTGGNGSCANGIDFSNTTFSGFAFLSNGFGVTPVGAINSGLAGVNNGTLNLSGVTSGTIAILTNSVSNLLTISQPVQIGIIGSTAGALNLAGLTSGSAQLSCSATGGSLQLGAGNVTVDTSGNIFTNGAIKIGNSTGLVAGGDAGHPYLYGTTATFGIFFGSGAPTISASQGSLYIRSDGTTNVTRAYINTTGSTTWTAINTVA
jgi:hypothetical protein